jgi:hypothetical protein
MHSKGGDKPITICALSFALDVAGGPNAASKRHGVDPSIASTSAAFKKRRGGHVDIDDDSSASLLPQSKKRTARKKSATKHRCPSHPKSTMYLILHGPKSCKIEYGLCLALQLV